MFVAFGSWANTRLKNLFTGAVIAILVTLSVILTASVLFPSITGTQILAVLVVGSVAGVGVTLLLLARQARRPPAGAAGGCSHGCGLWHFRAARLVFPDTRRYQRLDYSGACAEPAAIGTSWRRISTVKSSD
jgi:hypothetical protein